MLRRRAYLGIDLEGPPVPGGVRVQSVREGGPAAVAGLRAGDLVVSVNGSSVGEPSEITRALRASTDASVSICVERDSGTREVLVSAVPMPVESIEHGRVMLGEVQVGPHALRSIVTVPVGTPPFPAVLFLQGIEAGSCEHALAPNHPTLRLASSWTRAGIATMRVDRSGVGDSEGPPPAEYGLQAEIASANAGLEALLSNELVDPSRVFVFGASLGGMIAPLCPSISRARGIAAFGTSSRRWRTCIVASTERQLVLRGYRGEELDERLAAWAEMHAAVCRDELSPAEAMAQREHLASLESRECRGDTLFGRASAFFRELDATDLRAAWSEVDTDVLVIHGEYDWVCDDQDAASVALAVGERARRIELAGIGHDMHRHPSLEGSFRDASRGTWDDSLVEATVQWMRELPLDRR